VNALHKSCTLILGAACFGFSSLALAQTNSSQEPTTQAASRAQPPNQLDRAERDFIQKAAMGGLAEVELGTLAQQRASSEQVKSFASHMVRDHVIVSADLKQTVAGKGIQLPSSLDHEHQGDVARLKDLSGLAFDRAYMEQMVDDHKKDVKEFQRAAESSSDSSIKSFASKTLPTLQEHLRLAESTRESVRGAGSATK